MPLNNVAPVTMLLIPPVSHDLAAGAAGWVTTDISADIPASARVALIRSQEAGAGGVSGVRENGSSANMTGNWGISVWLEWCVGVNASKNVELYRHAAVNNYYQVIGYLR